VEEVLIEFSLKIREIMSFSQIIRKLRTVLFLEGKRLTHIFYEDTKKMDVLD